LYGTLTCGLPNRITAWLLRRKNPDGARIHQTRLAIGLLVYGIYFPALLVLVRPWLGNLGTVLFGASLAPAGLFALAYWRMWSGERERVRFAWLLATRGSMVRRLQRQRNRLIQEMDRLLNEYLELRERTETSPNIPGSARAGPSPT
ncbi:MAG TPA: hypothetical protein VFP10_08015, partial [Candidatus Eisenbacteria bacterium]|nr:hypothetical protein [Candidatus Eisenbacteria bacterium]